jgi:hypothetical protein
MGRHGAAVYVKKAYCIPLQSIASLSQRRRHQQRECSKDPCCVESEALEMNVDALKEQGGNGREGIVIPIPTELKNSPASLFATVKI